MSSKQMVDADVEVIEQICKEEISPIDPVSVKEVKTALKRLNNNKAVDIMGLTAEHFKLAGHELSEFLICFLNYVIDTGTVSVVLKEGILTPIFKKGDPSSPGNYRGITVTPVLLEILEHIPHHLLDPVCLPSSRCGYLIYTYVLPVALIIISLMTGMHVRA